MLLDRRQPQEEVLPDELDNPLVAPELRAWSNYQVDINDPGPSPRGDVARFRRSECGGHLTKSVTKSRRSSAGLYTGLKEDQTDSLNYPLRPTGLRGSAGYGIPFAPGVGSRPLVPPATASTLPSARRPPPPLGARTELEASSAFHAETIGSPVRVVLPRPNSARPHTAGPGVHAGATRERLTPSPYHG